MRAPRPRLLGGPGLQVVDLGFKCLRSKSREKEGGRDGETEADGGEGGGAGRRGSWEAGTGVGPPCPALPWMPAASSPQDRFPDSGPPLAAWAGFSWENGSCLVGLTRVVTGSPRPSVPGGAFSQAA